MKPNELKKLIKVCRELGVTHYKGENFEFSLGELPTKEEVKAKSATDPQVNPEFEVETLTEEQLLFYSVNDTTQDQRQVE